jgi:hypothetical protein
MLIVSIVNESVKELRRLSLSRRLSMPSMTWTGEAQVPRGGRERLVLAVVAGRKGTRPA